MFIEKEKKNGEVIKQRQHYKVFNAFIKYQKGVNLSLYMIYIEI